MPSTSGELFIGIDICKARLDVADDAELVPWSVANDESGIASLVTRLRKLHPTLIVMEATGAWKRSCMRR